MWSRVRVSCFVLLVLLPVWGQSSKDLTPQPVTQRQVLCWIVAGLPTFNIRYEIQTKGITFALDETWLQGLRSAGTNADIIDILLKAQPATTIAQQDEFTDRLLRIIKETNSKKVAAAQLHLAALVKLRPPRSQSFVCSRWLPQSPGRLGRSGSNLDGGRAAGSRFRLCARTTIVCLLPDGDSGLIDQGSQDCAGLENELIRTLTSF